MYKILIKLNCVQSIYLPTGFTQNSHWKYTGYLQTYAIKNNSLNRD